MRLLPTAAVLAVLAMPLPAQAVPGVFTGTMVVNCFGCGPSNAHASLFFTPGGPAEGDFLVDAETGSTCSASWTFTGRIAGGRNAFVNATVVGSQMVLTAVGDFTVGGGTASVVSPVGSPCGAPVEMTLVGWVV